MKTAIVSGGTDGIGKAIVQMLLDEGFHVVTFSRDKDRCAALQQELSAEVTVKTADVADESAMQALVEETVKAHDSVDLLVNNAGWGYWIKADEVDIAKFKALLDTNIVGVAVLTKHVIPHMKKQGSGKIINIASIAGIEGYVDGGFYCASKHAVMGYTKSVRKELNPLGIQVCAICPGMVQTNLFPDEVLESRKKNTGSLHMMRPEDIAHTVKMVVQQSDTSDIQDIVVRPG